MDKDMAAHFEKCGLVLGLIAYPFQLEGKDLYREVLEKQFFSNYKNGIDRYSLQKLPSYLYASRGYRSFGNYGLLVISLIDDFAFCDRIFHANNGYREESECDKNYQYSCKVITGISGTDEPDFLKSKAEQTFLRGDDCKRYPFIGINKLKINNDLLFGHGCELIEEIKGEIRSMLKNRILADGTYFDTIMVDCFDNDELAVVSFSNSIAELDKFFSSVRNLNYPFNREPSTLGSSSQKVFLSSYTNIGYDIDYRFDGKTSGVEFMDAIGMESVRLKLIWETKVGCYDKFKEYVQKLFGGDVSFDTNLIGGNTLSHKVAMNQIHELEKVCSEDKSVRNCVRKIKVVLSREEKPNADEPGGGSIESVEVDHDKFTEFLFKPKDLKVIRELLNSCRVGKILRERLLKIYGLFNESIRNSLHAPYLLELHGALSYIDKLLESFRDSDMEIGDIDGILSETITAFEEAYYNRFHQKYARDINLEYNGGIQQHITSFDFAYKEILRLLQPENDSEKHRGKNGQRIDESFLSVSGYERVTSMRMNLRININQITYPELFAISVWKEASNFTYHLLHSSYPGVLEGATPSMEQDFYDYEKILLAWNRFVAQKDSMINIGTFIKNQAYYNEDDEVFYLLSKVISRDTIDYLFIDAQVFHFGFNRDYALFYYSYWKYFLQISQHYGRDGKINKEYFVSYLLRLFMTGFRDNFSDEDKKCDARPFLEEQRFKPFDPVLAELWLMCYQKVYLFARTLWEELNKRHFEGVGDKRMAILDSCIVKDEPCIQELLEKADQLSVLSFRVVDERRKEIEYMKNEIGQAHLLDYDNNVKQSKDFIICLFNAYLHRIKELDENGRVGCRVRVVPRSAEGEVLLEDETRKEKEGRTDKDPIKEAISNLPSDPLGGMFTSNYETRGDYFACRTAFHRSLWNYTMKKRNLFNAQAMPVNE